MVKQKLYIGSNYSKGINGKKLLVVGHQKHATKEERKKYNDTKEYLNENENEDELKELINGVCMKWETGDRKCWLQFGRMLTGNISLKLDSIEASELWKSIAFCNYLQIPDYNLESRQGKDKESLYIYSESIFKEYLEESKPDKIIVWGIPYPYIAKLGIKINDNRCKIVLSNGIEADVLRINHPSRLETGGYDVTIKKIKDFLSD